MDLSRAKFVEQAHWFGAVGDFGRASLLKMNIPGPSAKGESNSEGLRWHLVICVFSHYPRGFGQSSRVWMKLGDK